MKNKRIIIHKFILLPISILFFLITINIIVLARPYTVCNGKEFNKRVKTLVDGGDVVADYRIMRFERGNTPPSNSDFYIDISEDNDESVIAYYTVTNPQDKDLKRVNLYWYATDNIIMNENTSLMFQGFANIQYIDLTGFSYFEGLDDVRYMFKDCRNLKKLILKPTGYNPADGNLFTPTEMQGMFYGCQSLQNIDLTDFNTYLVSNMAEMFCKCYNLRNIYVNNPNWNITSVTNFYRMFTDCHLLRSTKGKKAVDIADDDYEKYASLGINGEDSFVKDENVEYIDYVGSDEYVPIDSQGYLMEIPEAMDEYEDEPEFDGNGSDSINNSVGNSNEGIGVANESIINNQSQTIATIETTSSQSQSYLQNNTNESNIVLESATNEFNDTTIELQETETEIIESVDSLETINNQEDIIEGSNKRIIELDKYLNADGTNDKQDKNIIEVLWDDYQPLVITLLIAIFILLLLIGMVLYLYKEKKDTKDNNSNKL